MIFRSTYCEGRLSRNIIISINGLFAIMHHLFKLKCFFFINKLGVIQFTILQITIKTEYATGCKYLQWMYFEEILRKSRLL